MEYFSILIGSSDDEEGQIDEKTSTRRKPTWKKQCVFKMLGLSVLAPRPIIQDSKGKDIGFQALTDSIISAL
jgi:hypothetical protein